MINYAVLQSLIKAQFLGPNITTRQCDLEYIVVYTSSNKLNSLSYNNGQHHTEAIKRPNHMYIAEVPYYYHLGQV